MRRDRKVVWVYPNTIQPECCTVMLVDKYVSLCPGDFTKKDNFYLQSKIKPNPACWYTREVLGENTIGKVIGSMMEAARYQGFYSGHSLRRSGGTRLFQAGVQRKLVKEVTGHLSDAVDKYQITSDKQQATMSKILESKPSTANVPTSTVTSEIAGTALDEKCSPKLEVKPTPTMGINNPSCSCTTSKYGGLIEQIICSINANGKAKIRIEIEVSKD